MHTDNYKNKMNDDISQSVSQGSNGAQDEKDSRIAAIANELERLCSVHEAQCGNSQQNVSRLDTEQRAAEQMAKSQGYWMISLILECQVQAAMKTILMLVRKSYTK